MHIKELTLDKIEKSRSSKLGRGNLSIQRGFWRTQDESNERRKLITAKLPATLDKLNQAREAYNAEFKRT